MYICISEGKGFISWAVKFFLTMLLRREKMNENKTSWFLAPLLMFLSFLGLTKYSKLKAKFTHTFLAYYSHDFGRWFSIDITNKGIVLMPLEKSLSNSSFTSVFACNFDIWTGIRATTDYFGDSYDWEGIFSTAKSVLLFVFCGKRPSKINHSIEKFFCSEFVVTVINNSNINTSLGNPPEIDPSLLYQLTKGSKDFRVLVERENLTITDLYLAIVANNQE